MHLSTESQFDVLHAILLTSSRVSPQLVSPLCPFHQLFPLDWIILIGIQTFCISPIFLLKEKSFKKMSNLLLTPTFLHPYCLILLLSFATKLLEEVTHIHCLQFLSQLHKSTPTKLALHRHFFLQVTSDFQAKSKGHFIELILLDLMAAFDTAEQTFLPKTFSPLGF